jgi:hypothetical protein
MKSTRAVLPHAKRWLKECCEAHVQCKPSVDKRIPTRLVHIEKNNVRLVEGDFGDRLDYATLSHSWGNIKFFMLKRRNHNALKNHIPLEKLSQTFNDAIEVARELGFAYIWIDSLCIIQDDPQDWERESGLMSDVYRGSGLNIAASGAIDGTSGCFFKLPANRTCQVQVKQGNQICTYKCVTWFMYTDCLSNMPLMQRGWALQERLLPPRTLHFALTEVFWECHSKVACETFPEQCPPPLGYFKKKPTSMWNWIVERYSPCKLTKPKDKLIAISGLARIIQQHTGDQYVAGMWREDLELQLCWYNRGFSPPRQVQRTFPYRAPTWSWASLDCNVLMWRESEQGLQRTAGIWIKVLDVQVQTLGSDPFGELSMAQLRLSCVYLVDVSVEMEPTGKYLEDIGKGVLTIGGGSLCCRILFDCLDEDEYCKPQSAKAMPVFRTSGSEVTGLLLNATGEERGQYQRLGWFCFEELEASKAFESKMIKPSNQVSEEEYLEFETDKDGKIHRVITLV